MIRQLPRGAAIACALLLPSTVARAQRPISPTTPNDTRPSIPLDRPTLGAGVVLDTTAVNTLKWREIGPYRGGRSVAVAGSAARPNEYYMGTTGGGVFKSLDGGQSWAPVTDKYFGGTIGAIAVAPSNPDVVYVGGGEYPMRGNVSHGEGVWKSTDAGRTWSSLGLQLTRQISRVRVHPTNPDIVYVAAQGNVWAPTPDRGIFRSRDGGRSWQKILFRNDSTGAADLVMDPSNPNVLYAAFWQAGRTPWMLVSGGAGSAIFKTTNGGDTWQDITRNPGLPAGILGNMGLSVSGANPNRVFAIIEADSGGVYRSNDAGATWTRTNSDRSLRQRAWYYTKIHADTKDTNVVYVNNVNFQKSTDGGKTFRPVRGIPHGDSHDFWIAPNDNRRMIEGDDGGASASTDGGRTWTDQDYATAQFYHVITTNHFPYQICGAQQDNSTLCGPSRKPGGIDIADWKEAGGGESGYIASRSDDPDVVYAGSYGALLTRKDLRTGLSRNINPWPDNPMGHSAIDLKYRFQWTYPIVLSPHNPNVLYATSNYVHRTTNDGQSWQVISPDLTRNDPRTLGPSGGPLTKDQTSVEYYGTIFSFAESPKQRGVLWTGSDDGLVHVSRDNGATWQNVTPSDMAPYTRVSLIEPGHFAAGTAYVAANRFQLDDMKPYLWKTTNYGQSWTRIDAGITPTEFTRAIREDPEKPGLLFAGTERGVWFSPNDGASWQRLQNNLPPVPVHDLAIREGDLIAATHGRSFWVIDDISALRQLTPAITAKNAHLFKPRDAYRVSFAGRGGGGGGAGNAPAGPPVHPVAVSPAGGPVVHFWLKRPAREVQLEFLDASGKLIRSFTSRQDSAVAADSLTRAGRARARVDSLRASGIPADSAERMVRRSAEATRAEQGGSGGEEEEGPVRRPPPPRVPNKAGINDFAWNMRYPDASTFDGLIMWAGNVQGPVAPPGTYAVRMIVDGAPVGSEQFRLLKDPRSTATPADLAAQFAFLTQVRDRLSNANDAVKTIRYVRAQLADREKKLTGEPLAQFKSLAGPLAIELASVEDSVYQTKNRSGQDPLNYPIRLNNKIAALSGVASSAEAKPTEQTTTVYRSLSSQLDVQLGRMKRALDSSLPRINNVLKAAGQPEIIPRAVEMPAAKVDVVSEDDDDM
ncbi:MAG: WD40/YVTN/BNR-like repeat-containing protein [Gemmatimonadaceae bacterium]